uniref:NADH-ubiquinone oxidoreductase chain 6 n=1 Tax=Galerita orientalis TaxID=2898108 RepID=A0A976UH63_9CARA|nr:NADH dehydrogenase subunit 6 [Galerita orientalis]UVH65778.1 NADH dehydrogenase subunit 6 [Galerita orientalis]
MYYMMILISMMMTILFLFMNHPLSMGLILLIQTILISLITGLFSLSYWFSYILFLIMIGGMLILFIYMTSMASNEMFNFSPKLFLWFMMTLFITLLFYNLVNYIIMNPFMKNSNIMEMINEMVNLKNENIFSLNMIYNKPNNLITLLLVNYLFLTLIAVVKITDINYGPLRQKF